MAAARRRAAADRVARLGSRHASWPHSTPHSFYVQLGCGFDSTADTPPDEVHCELRRGLLRTLNLFEARDDRVWYLDLTGAYWPRLFDALISELRSEALPWFDDRLCNASAFRRAPQDESDRLAAALADAERYVDALRELRGWLDDWRDPIAQRFSAGRPLRALAERCLPLVLQLSETYRWPSSLQLEVIGALALLCDRHDDRVLATLRRGLGSPLCDEECASRVIRTLGPRAAAHTGAAAAASRPKAPQSTLPPSIPPVR